MATKFNFKSFLNWLKQVVIQFLKKRAVTASLKLILGSAATGGFWGFIITYIVDNLFTEVAEPIIKLAFEKEGYLYDRVNGEIKLKKLNKAENTGNVHAADQVLDNI